MPGRIDPAPRRVASAGGPQAHLGKTAKSVDQEARKKAASSQRALDFSHQRTAAKILPRERVGLCRWSVVSKAAGVDVVINTYDREDGERDERAAYVGLQTCGSVWLCPCCGRRISEKRRGELNHLLAWARAEGLQPVMLTLTARHRLGDDLAAQLDGMKNAKRRLRQRREWRAIKGRIVGTVTATEVTHGKAGWHTHFHELALVRADSEAEALALFAAMPRVWRSCLRGVGLDATLARGWQAQGAAAAGGYFAKWGAGEELAFGARKSAAEGGRTPRQLLAAAADGDAAAGRLWATYGCAFKGARQLVWSPGLKALAGVDEVDDAEAAKDARQGQEQRTVTNIAHQSWAKGARHHRAAILDAAEDASDDMAAAAAVRAVIEASGEDQDGGAVIEDHPQETPDRWTPPPMRPGGLAARAVAVIRSDTGVAPPLI